MALRPQLEVTPDAINKELVGVRFVAEYTKYAYIPQLDQYRHVLRIQEGATLVSKLAGVFEKHPYLEQDSSIRITPNGGLELLLCFDAQHPFGVHEWQIRSCQIYKTPRKYLLLWVNRLTSINISKGDFLNVSTKDVFLAVKEGCKMLVLLFVMLVHAVLQLAWILHSTVSVLMVHTPRIINSLNPIIFAVVNALTKCVGGLYLLIAMMWNGRGNPVPASQHQVQPLSHRPMIAASDKDWEESPVR